jgi:3-oxoadipate enol-lactonase
MAFVTHDGRRIHYELHGLEADGASEVVLLHGLGSCGDDWPLQLQALMPRHRILTLDLPGHGTSDPPRGWPRISQLAEAVGRVMDETLPGPAHVVGLSLGGAVALRLAVDQPHKVRSLTAVNTFARLRSTRSGRGHALRRLTLLLTAPMARVGAWVAQGLFPHEGQESMRRLAAERIAGNSRLAYWKSIGAVLGFDLRSRLGEIRCPTLVVAGQDDATVPMAAKVELQRAIPRARLAVIPRSGHATPLDAPQAFNALLLGFLDEMDGLADG